MNSDLSLVMATFSSEGGPGGVQLALAKEFHKQGIDVRTLNRAENSLWEAPFSSPEITFRAAIDEFLVKNSHFGSPISLFRQPRNPLLVPDSKFDFAVLGWLPGLLTEADYKLFSQTPTIIRLPDENPYTGACHYARDCNKFQIGCSSCPAVRSFAGKKVSANLQRKRGLYSQIRRKAFVAPSEWIASRARSSYLLREEMVAVIRNPIDPIFFTPRPSLRNGPKLRVLMVASQVFDPVKGLGELLRLLEPMVESGLFSVTVAGNAGSKKQEFRNIEFTGRLNKSELAQQYADAHVTVVPSKSEASGNVVAESLACGTPAFVRDIDGLGEIVSQVNKDWLFQSNNDLINMLVSFDPQDLIHTTREMRDVAQNHNPTKVAEAYLAILTAL